MVGWFTGWLVPDLAETAECLDVNFDWRPDTPVVLDDVAEPCGSTCLPHPVVRHFNCSSRAGTDY